MTALWPLEDHSRPQLCSHVCSFPQLMVCSLEDTGTVYQAKAFTLTSQCCECKIISIGNNRVEEKTTNFPHTAAQGSKKVTFQSFLYR